MKIKSHTLLLFLTLMVACKEQQPSQKAEPTATNQINTQKKAEVMSPPQTTNNPDSLIEINDSLLKQQFKKQKDAVYYWEDDERADDFRPYGLKTIDIDVLIPVVRQGLKKSGYTFPASDEYNWKVRQIFGNYVIGQEPWRGIVYHPYDQDANIDYCGRFREDPSRFQEQFYYRFPEFDSKEEAALIASHGFITDFLLLNEAVKFKPDSSYTIALPERILHRNFYLFNNQKSRLPWLLMNDEDFMYRLVWFFGWDKDDKLNQWALDRRRLKDLTSTLFYGEIYYNKNCDGRFKLNSGMFRSLQKKVDRGFEEGSGNLNPFFGVLVDEFFEYMGHLSWYSPEDISGVEVLKLQQHEKVALMANMVYFLEQYKYSHNKTYPRAMGRLRNWLSDEEKAMLINNNYYKLPRFKQWWNNALYDQYYAKLFDGNYIGLEYEPLGKEEFMKNPEYHLRNSTIIDMKTGKIDDRVDDGKPPTQAQIDSVLKPVGPDDYKNNR